MTTTELYRHYDKDGRLLYVGVSFDSRGRWLSHKSSKALWAPISVRMNIERFPTRAAALAAEHDAITNERPVYNQNGGQSPNKSKPLNAGYARALDAAKKISGKDHGAASWLAAKIGASRQALFYWSTAGFPDDITKEVCKATGLPQEDVATITISIPSLAWKHICEMAPKELTNQAIIIIK